MRRALACACLLLGGCVSDSIQFDPTTHQFSGRRIALMTNIGALHATVTSGTVTATVDEQAVDQATASANAVQAAAQAVSTLAAKIVAP